MPNYFVELPGKLSLAKQSTAIEGEEALGTRFVGARMWVNAANVLTNLAEFEELDTQPNPPLGKPVLTKALPAGTTPAWTGALIVQGSAVGSVFLMRQ